MVGRIIDSVDDLADGMAWLCGVDPALAQAYSVTGPLRLRRKEDGFQPLLSAIVSQQVSVASADAIWGRMCEAGMTEIDPLCLATDEDLRACGLSRQKARYARALATSGIDFDGLRMASVEDIVATLTAVTGVGVWTAEIYAMFSLGRSDVFPSGDLALQEAARMIYDLDERPKDKALREMAEAWSPWRSVAACLLWAYYAEMKKREGIR